METYDWIIGICNTGKDGVSLLRFRGTRNEAKEKLVQLVANDRKADEENWDYGTEETDDVQTQDNCNGYELYAYGCYHDYHIDYNAKEWAHIEFA